MNEQDVRETMEQIHIPEQMKEEIFMSMKEQMSNEKAKSKNRRKKAAAVAAAAVAVCALALPVQAMVKSLVEARMESIPKEEVQNVSDMVQSQDVEADTLSRPYSESEKARMKQLRQAYENGTFPEKKIVQVESTQEVAEGTLCYDKVTATYYFPAREMTDEELLEIIDFRTEIDYALSQTEVTKEAQAECAAKEARLKEQLEAIGGINEEEAVKIAESYMKSDIGAAAEGKDDVDVFLANGSDMEPGYDADVMYVVSFGNVQDKSTYTCEVDAADGSVLHAEEYRP